MSLLIFISSLSSGGAERVTANLADVWFRSGRAVTVVTLAGDDSDFYGLPVGVRRVSLGLSAESKGALAAIKSNLRRVLALRRVLRITRPHIALSMMDQSNVLLAIAAIGLRNVRTIGSERIHPPTLLPGRAWQILRSWTYGLLDAVVAQTSESADWIRSHTSAREVVVIPNPVVLPLSFRPPLLEPPTSGDRRLLLAVGRLCDQKGFDILIRIFAALAPFFPQWQLVILGEGPARPVLEGVVRAHNMATRILLPGRAGNVAQWYEAADIYVMSSRFEGFPNTLLEALAHGVPSVSFDCDTGPRDLIRNGRDGLLVPPSNEDAMRDALRTLMEDEAMRTRFSTEATSVRERYSISSVVGLWDSLFLRVSR